MWHPSYSPPYSPQYSTQYSYDQPRYDDDPRTFQDRNQHHYSAYSFPKNYRGPPRPRPLMEHPYYQPRRRANFAARNFNKPRRRSQLHDVYRVNSEVGRFRESNKTGSPLCYQTEMDIQEEFDNTKDLPNGTNTILNSENISPNKTEVICQSLDINDNSSSINESQPSNSRELVTESVDSQDELAAIAALLSEVEHPNNNSVPLLKIDSWSETRARLNEKHSTFISDLYDQLTGDDEIEKTETCIINPSNGCDHITHLQMKEENTCNSSPTIKESPDKNTNNPDLHGNTLNKNPPSQESNFRFRNLFGDEIEERPHDYEFEEKIKKPPMEERQDRSKSHINISKYKIPRLKKDNLEESALPNNIKDNSSRKFEHTVIKELRKIRKSIDGSKLSCVDTQPQYSETRTCKDVENSIKSTTTDNRQKSHSGIQIPEPKKHNQHKPESHSVIQTQELKKSNQHKSESHSGIQTQELKKNQRKPESHSELQTQEVKKHNQHKPGASENKTDARLQVSKKKTEKNKEDDKKRRHKTDKLKRRHSNGQIPESDKHDIKNLDKDSKEKISSNKLKTAQSRESQKVDCEEPDIKRVRLEVHIEKLDNEIVKRYEKVNRESDKSTSKNLEKDKKRKSMDTELSVTQPIETKKTVSGDVETKQKNGEDKVKKHSKHKSSPSNKDYSETHQHSSLPPQVSDKKKHKSELRTENSSVNSASPILKHRSSTESEEEKSSKKSREREEKSKKSSRKDSEKSSRRSSSEKEFKKHSHRPKTNQNKNEGHERTTPKDAPAEQENLLNTNKSQVDSTAAMEVQENLKEDKNKDKNQAELTPKAAVENAENILEANPNNNQIQVEQTPRDDINDKQELLKILDRDSKDPDSSSTTITLYRSDETLNALLEIQATCATIPTSDTEPLELKSETAKCEITSSIHTETETGQNTKDNLSVNPSTNTGPPRMSVITNLSMMTNASGQSQISNVTPNTNHPIAENATGDINGTTRINVTQIPNYSNTTMSLKNMLQEINTDISVTNQTQGSTSATDSNVSKRNTNESPPAVPSLSSTTGTNMNSPENDFMQRLAGLTSATAGTAIHEPIPPVNNYDFVINANERRVAIELLEMPPPVSTSAQSMHHPILPIDNSALQKNTVESTRNSNNGLAGPPIALKDFSELMAPKPTSDENNGSNSSLLLMQAADILTDYFWLVTTLKRANNIYSNFMRKVSDQFNSGINRQLEEEHAACNGFQDSRIKLACTMMVQDLSQIKWEQRAYDYKEILKLVAEKILEKLPEFNILNVYLMFSEMFRLIEDLNHPHLRGIYNACKNNLPVTTPAPLSPQQRDQLRDQIACYNLITQSFRQSYLNSLRGVRKQSVMNQPSQPYPHTTMHNTFNERSRTNPNSAISSTTSSAGTCNIPGCNCIEIPSSHLKKLLSTPTFNKNTVVNTAQNRPVYPVQGNSAAVTVPQTGLANPVQDNYGTYKTYLTKLVEENNNSAVTNTRQRQTTGKRKARSQPNSPTCSTVITTAHTNSRNTLKIGNCTGAINNVPADIPHTSPIVPTPRDKVNAVNSNVNNHVCSTILQNTASSMAARNQTTSDVSPVAPKSFIGSNTNGAVSRNDPVNSPILQVSTNISTDNPIINSSVSIETTINDHSTVENPDDDVIEIKDEYEDDETILNQDVPEIVHAENIQDSSHDTNINLQNYITMLIKAERTCVCKKPAEYVCLCKAAIYCSEECQNAEWKNHKPVCTFISSKHNF